jgi:hypothetical protein
MEGSKREAKIERRRDKEKENKDKIKIRNYKSKN